MTYQEPEWGQDQVDLLLAHKREMRDIGPHGQPMSEATDPQANPSVFGGWHYEAADRPIVDYAQLAVSKAQEAYEKNYGDRLTDAQRRSHQWHVRRVDD